MKTIFNIIFGCILFSTTLTTTSAQDLHWILNNEFTESGNTITNTKPQHAFSYLMSVEVLESGLSSGSVSLTNFEIDGNSISGFNFLGQVTLGLSEDNNPLQGYRLVMFKSPLTQNGGIAIPNVRVFNPQGEMIGELLDITLSSSNVLEINKTAGNVLQFNYNGTTIATVLDANAPQYRALISTTIGALSTTYTQTGLITTAASFPQPNVTDTDKNWTSVKTFDTRGVLTSASVGYFDCLGRTTQAQTKDLLTGKTWATETRYDLQGRPALSTLAAPITDSTNFSYKDDFIVRSNGSPYTATDFENNPELPNIVGTTQNTVGAYYSTANIDEPYQDITDRPYSRTVYDELNPGAVRAVAGGNKAYVSGASGLQYNFPQGYSHTMPAAQELYYAFGKDYFPENKEAWFEAQGIPAISVTNTMLTHRAIKTVAIDAHGNETIVFTDLEGKTLAAARSGGTTTYDVRSVIGPQGYVDVHIPTGISSANVNLLGGNNGYTIWDLRTGKQVNAAAMTGGHIYRVASNPQDIEDMILTITTSGIINSQANAKGIAYQVNYYDYALNYYDETGNLLESVQPLGFDDATLTGGLNVTPQHSMTSSYAYNSLGQLLSTASPDEGSASFIYRKDGQIRFSQNTKQQGNDEFSYTNYDDYARPLESGVCAADFPMTGDGITSFNIIANEPGNLEITQNSVKKIANNGSGSSFEKGGFYSTDAITGDFKLTFNSLYIYKFIGLTQTNYTSNNFNHINYAIYTRISDVEVRENGIHKTAYIPGYNNSGTKLSIQRIGTTITYWMEGILLYTNSNASDQPLHLDGNFSSTNGRFEDITIEYLNTSTTAGDDLEIDPALCSERTFTLYDIPDQTGLDDALGTLPSRNQQFLAGNVSKTWTEDPATNATWYSYDIYGRVSWMVQDIVGLGTKIIDYEYNDITGEVIKIKYSGDSDELFIHKYTYNQVGQLITVATSHDDLTYKEQARYVYYETGALKRTILAEDVQGIDYVYNISGALKSINHPSLDENKDPGGDANDVFGMIIDYHRKDYKRTANGITTTIGGINRYDGNIKATRWAIDNGDSGDPVTQSAYTYTYDHNKWLTSANFGTASTAGGISINSNEDYKVSNLSYDPNGNLLSLSRNKNTYNGSNAMDNFTYHYTPGTNQLNYVSDAATASEDSGDLESQSTGNYTYNTIGQLTHNAQDQIQYHYTTSGLVSSIASTDPLENTSLSFGYNDRGHRISKILTTPSNTTQTYYVRDASGQPLAIYNGTGTANIEYPIYGSSRLGISRDGDDQYEITDHLGNVRAVVKATANTGGDAIIFSDDFDDGVVAPWVEAHNPLSETGGALRAIMTTNYPTAETYVVLPIPLIAGHQYEVSLTNSTEDNIYVGITAQNGGDTQEAQFIAGANDHIFTATTSGQYELYLKAIGGFIGGNYDVRISNVLVEDVTPVGDGDQLLQAYKDYYPFGMAMPNRNVEGDYRYAYQGQEKDPETGKEAFELRLWDARIGRWLTTDPYSQYSSPYMGMDNNPINSIDPNGGCTNCAQCPDACKEARINDIPANQSLDVIDLKLVDYKIEDFGEIFINPGNSRDTWNDLFQYSRAQYWDFFRYREKNLWMADFYGGRQALGKGVFSIIGAAVAPLVIIEIVPVAIANSSFTTAGFGGRASVNLIEQSITKGIAGESLGDINLLDVAISGLTPPGSKALTNKILGSSINLTVNNGFEFNENAILDFATGEVIGGIHSKIDGLVPGNLGATAQIYGEVGKSIFSILGGAVKSRF